MIKLNDLYTHQLDALDEMRVGSILWGGVGSGKSRTSLAFYFKSCGGLKNGEFGHMDDPLDLYIITTARKRDTMEWITEAAPFALASKRENSVDNVQVTVDSWNNIGKYVEVEDAFFIFDEQRVVGSGAWVKSFLKIARNNKWILLSATPGDNWMDYIPVFIANGFYKNRTEFIRKHVVYNNFTKFPKVERYVNTGVLQKYRKQILVHMPYKREIKYHYQPITVDYDAEDTQLVMTMRWNPFKSEPIKDISELCYTARRVANSDLSRLEAVKDIIYKKQKVIIFYNFDYELEILRKLSDTFDIPIAEWNGHKHDPLPKGPSWVYLVQYNAGAEGWNCVETDTIIFYSQNYSYKMMAQAAGRIDRLNSPYSDLYYYVLKSNAPIDVAVGKTLANKKTFNESTFA